MRARRGRSCENENGGGLAPSPVPDRGSKRRVSSGIGALPAPVPSRPPRRSKVQKPGGAMPRSAGLPGNGKRLLRLTKALERGLPCGAWPSRFDRPMKEGAPRLSRNGAHRPCGTGLGGPRRGRTAESGERRNEAPGDADAVFPIGTPCAANARRPSAARSSRARSATSSPTRSCSSSTPSARRASGSPGPESAA